MHLIYVSPAAGKYETNVAYKLDDLRQELSDEMIRVCFKPIDFKWEDLDSKKEVKKEIIVSEE